MKIEITNRSKITKIVKTCHLFSSVKFKAGVNFKAYVYDDMRVRNLDLPLPLNPFENFS